MRGGPGNKMAAEEKLLVVVGIHEGEDETLPVDCLYLVTYGQLSLPTLKHREIVVSLKPYSQGVARLLISHSL